MEAVYGVEGFPKLWFEPRSKNILVVGQSNSYVTGQPGAKLTSRFGRKKGETFAAMRLNFCLVCTIEGWTISKIIICVNISLESLTLNNCKCSLGAQN